MASLCRKLNWDIFFFFYFILFYFILFYLGHNQCIISYYQLLYIFITHWRLSYPRNKKILYLIHIYVFISQNYCLHHLTKKASLFEREECTNRNIKKSLQTYIQLDKYCSKWHCWAFIVLFEQTNNNYAANTFQLTRRGMLHYSNDHYNIAKSCICVYAAIYL